MSTRRGSILLVVFGVIVLTALAAASVLRRSTSASWTATGADRRLAPRLAAWSGVEAVMGELASQRPEILRGAPPRLTQRIVITEVEHPLVARLIPLEGQLAVSECGRIDINRVPVDWIGRVPGLSQDIAYRIDTARCIMPLGSVEELQRLGLQAESLAFGIEQAEPGAGPSFAALLGTFVMDTTEPALGDPFAPPICLCEPLNDTDCQALNAIAGLDLCAIIKARVDSGKPITTRAEFAQLCMAAAVDAKRVGELLDRVTLAKQRIVPGRIDLNAAPAGVLAALPGLDLGSAERIVRARELTPDEDRRNVLWPVIAGAVEMENFAQALDWVGVRSLVWRVRVEAGVELDTANTPGDASSGDPPQPLKHRAALEAVIDLSTSRPRVVYLRDVTHLAIAASLAAIVPPEEPETLTEESSEASAAAEATESPGEPAPATKLPTGRVSRWSVPK